ncbi:MAG TPA: fumarylacetoacetate hydrolase family protein [Gaiellaceae bacterium]|nr:fumarylacetoacetate hydrolase family protein [Gaiellaceae bacterium]
MTIAASNVLEAHAAALRDAELARSPIQPLTDEDPGLTIADAYAIQDVNIRQRLAEGCILRGRKIGLTSRAMQTLLGVDEPDFGALLDDMFADDGALIPVDALIQPKAEAEIAFVLARDLAGPGVTTIDALRAIEAAIAAIEVVDSRIRDWQITIADTIADNASSGRVVLGTRLVPVHDIDLQLVGMGIWHNGALEDSGAGVAALGHPARCVAWLANTLGAFGSGLSAGDVVMSGALHRAFDVVRGDTVKAEFDRLGSVSVRFG